MILFFLGIFFLEAVALGCGIAARRTAPGKAGIVISGAALMLCVLFIAFWVLSPVRTTHHAAMPTATERGTSGSSSPPPLQAFPTPSTVPSTSASTQPSVITVPATPGVAPTLDELAHVLAELPAPFRAHLEGNTQQQIADLDTHVWVMDFEKGPASFWLETSEHGQQTFPKRLPMENPATSWNIDHPGAHILMWLQPRASISMKEQLRLALQDSKEAPDYAFGIDVDGKPVCRQANYPGFSEPKRPLWHNLWIGESVETQNGGFDFSTAAQGIRAMLLIQAKETHSKDPRSVQFGLWYRPKPHP